MILRCNLQEGMDFGMDPWFIRSPKRTTGSWTLWKPLGLPPHSNTMLMSAGAVRAGGFKRFLEEAEDAGTCGRPFSQLGEIQVPMSL